MSFRIRKNGPVLTAGLLDTWDEINSSSLPDDDRGTYENRVLAIKLYATGESTGEITRRSGIGKQELYRFVARCLSRSRDGSYLGYKGLVPYGRLLPNNYSATSDSPSRIPKTGALTRLFQRYPSIEQALVKAAVEGKREGQKIVEKNMPVGAIHSYFLKLCEKSGIRGPDYPFSADSDSEGLPALRRWTRKIRTQHALTYLRANGQESKADKITAHGDPSLGSRRARSFYKQVELDGHKIDIPLKVAVPSPIGEGIVWRSVNRIWIIAAITRRVSVCLGYSYALGTNYSGRDVVRAIQNSMVPWSPRKLSIEGKGYGEGDGMPNASPDLTYISWNELWLDNAMAHRSEHVLHQCSRMAKAILVFSPVSSPDTHPWVEGFFNLLEEAGIHRMPTTTGSNTKDRRRGTSSDLRYHLTLQQLEDLIDLLVCRINGSRAPGNTEYSRLELLRHSVTRGDSILWRLRKEDREDVAKYDMYEKHRIGQNHGVVVVRFAYGRYTSDKIKAAKSLIGKTVLLMANSQKLRVIHAVLEDGTDLGDLNCERRYQETEFSYETMKEIKACEGESFIAFTDDIPRAFRRHIEKEALKSAKATRTLMRLQKEQSVQSSGPQESSDFDSETDFTNQIPKPVRSDRNPKRSNESIQDEDIEYEKALKELNGIGNVYR